MVTPVVEVKNLKKYFKVLNRHEGLMGAIKDLFSRDYLYIKAVDGISMEIYEGEIVGFLGPNGAGKSTTIKILTGVLFPDDGEVKVNGVVPYINRINNAKNIGVVFGQRTQLWWSLPLIESFKILKDIYEIDDTIFKENLQIFEEIVGLETLYNKPIRQMSLGQRVLCDILASFLHDPKVVILDEPTIGLDLIVKDKVRKLIRELNKRKNTTIILATHDMSDVEALCSRIIIIDKGKIIYDGSLDKLKDRFKIYRKVKIRLKKDLVETEIANLENLLFAKFGNSLFSLNIISSFIEINFKPEDINVVDILQYVSNFCTIDDVATEEPQTEDVIRFIYRGESK
jgi:ABC-2 type transport system ATP-binding protein